MKRHAGSGIPHGHLNKGTERKPSPYHGGSGKPKGTVNAAPRTPQVNAANYGRQQVKRK